MKSPGSRLNEEKLAKKESPIKENLKNGILSFIRPRRGSFGAGSRVKFIERIVHLRPFNFSRLLNFFSHFFPVPLLFETKINSQR